jgi:hypothetical protein
MLDLLLSLIGRELRHAAFAGDALLISKLVAGEDVHAVRFRSCRGCLVEVDSCQSRLLRRDSE